MTSGLLSSPHEKAIAFGLNVALRMIVSTRSFGSEEGNACLRSQPGVLTICGQIYGNSGLNGAALRGKRSRILVGDLDGSSIELPTIGPAQD